MCFKIPRSTWIQACLLVSPPYKSFLSISTRLRYSRCAPILVRSCGAYYRSDGIAVPNGVSEEIDDNHTEAFASSITVSTVIETETSTFWGKEIHVRQRQERVKFENGIEAGYKCLHVIISSSGYIKVGSEAYHCEFTVTQSLACDIKSYHTTRASSVKIDAESAQLEEPAESISKQSHSVTSSDIFWQCLQVPYHHHLIVVRKRSRIHSCFETSNLI